jgi:hypothetical protein
VDALDMQVDLAQVRRGVDVGFLDLVEVIDGDPSSPAA